MCTNLKMNSLFYNRSRCFLLNPIQVKGNSYNFGSELSYDCEKILPKFTEIKPLWFSLTETEVSTKLMIKHETKVLIASVCVAIQCKTTIYIPYRT